MFLRGSYELTSPQLKHPLQNAEQTECATSSRTAHNSRNKMRKRKNVCVKWVRLCSSRCAFSRICPNHVESFSVVWDKNNEQKRRQNLRQSGRQVPPTGGVNCHNWGVWNAIKPAPAPAPAHLFMCGVTTLGEISFYGLCSALIAVAQHWFCCPLTHSSVSQRPS